MKIWEKLLIKISQQLILALNACYYVLYAGPFYTFYMIFYCTTQTKTKTHKLKY